MGNSDVQKVRAKSVTIERVTVTQSDFATMSLMRISEGKQKETLIRYLYLPFWISLNGILILFAVVLALSGVWFLFLGFVFFSGFSTYTIHTSTKNLKKIKEELSTLASPLPLEQSTTQKQKGKNRVIELQ